MFWLVFIFFIFGLLVGSFLNVVADSLVKGRSFIVRRSACPHCQHSLAGADLIPIWSFISLGGKCLYCQQTISWQYPFVELATGILFGLVGAFFPILTFNFFYLPWSIFRFFVV